MKDYEGSAGNAVSCNQTKTGGSIYSQRNTLMKDGTDNGHFIGGNFGEPLTGNL